MDDRAGNEAGLKPIAEQSTEMLLAEVELQLSDAGADDEILDELKARFDDMQDQIDRLTRLKLEGVNYAPGLLDIKVSFELCRVMAAHFWNILEQAEAQNYVEIHFADQSKGRTAALEFNSPDMVEKITVLIQRSLGKTPHQLRREAEQRYDELRTAATLAGQKIIEMDRPDGIDPVVAAFLDLGASHGINFTLPGLTMAAEAENGNDAGGSGSGGDLHVRSDGEDGAETGGQDAGSLGAPARPDDGEPTGPRGEADDRGPGVEAEGGGGPGDDRQPEGDRGASAAEGGGGAEEGVLPGDEVGAAAAPEV